MSSSASSLTTACDRLLACALFLLLLWVPIPIGSTQPWHTGVMEVVCFSLLSACLTLRIFTRHGFPVIDPSVRAILLLFIASLAYQLLQVIPLPPEVLRMLSPAAYTVYSINGAESAKETYSISLGVELTLREFLKSATYVSLFFLTLALIRSRARLVRLAYLLIFLGFAQCIFGMLDAYLGGILFKIPFGPGRGTGMVVTGTYISYNQFAFLLEMAIPVTAGMVLTQSAGQEWPHDWRARVVAFANWLLSRHIWLFLCLLTLITLLLYSRSRGGAISLLIASSVAFGIALVNRGVDGHKLRRLLTLALPVAIALWLGAWQLLARLETQGLDTNRHLHREIAYRVIADYPVFGVGGGNWIDVYPAYDHSATYVWSVLNHVHNDYLELLAEQGVIGFVLFGSAVLIALGTMIDALRRRRDPLMRGVLFGCVTATISTLIHALVDFNFHVPAHAAWFSVILAMGLIASRMPHDA